MEDLMHLNWLAIFLAALAMFLLGAVWYTALFGKRWQALLGFSDEYVASGSIVGTYLSGFVCMLFMAVGLAFLMQHHPQAADPMNGMRYGLWLGLFFIGTSTAINYIFQRRSTALWFIDAGYLILGLGLMGAIIGYFS
jgi:Protein of unknown function (DUF1761)